jgi:tRNA G18 (ribose-2'-O)-methylase SpoU
VDRFGRARADLAKVALGAEKSVAWESVTGTPSVSEVISFVKKMKKDGVTIIALEQDKRSVPYREAIIKKSYSSNILLIIGNEVDGVNPDLLDVADIIAEIPMRGKKESLNVSVAVGVALFGMFD